MNDTTNHNELLLATLARIAEALEKQNEILIDQTQALTAIANRIEDAGGVYERKRKKCNDTFGATAGGNR